MKVKPILFSTEMVRALLDGRKTQTRRVMSPQPEPKAPGYMNDEPSWYWRHKNVTACGYCHTNREAFERLALPCCPYGVPGDLLWVRETCRAEELPRDGADYVRYFADDSLKLIDNTREAAERWHALRHYRGKRGATVPPIHMPRWASRMTLRLTEVRVQRVQEISQQDVFAEGLTNHAMNTIYGGGTAQTCFGRLWDKINAARGYGWDANPWVWCLSFDVIRANVDQVLKEAA